MWGSSQGALKVCWPLDELLLAGCDVSTSQAVCVRLSCPWAVSPIPTFLSFPHLPQVVSTSVFWEYKQCEFELVMVAQARVTGLCVTAGP